VKALSLAAGALFQGKWRMSNNKIQSNIARYRQSSSNDLAAAVFAMQHLAEDLVAKRIDAGTTQPWTLSEKEFDEIDSRLKAICSGLGRARHRARTKF
jgi:hypothetical protein